MSERWSEEAAASAAATGAANAAAATATAFVEPPRAHLGSLQVRDLPTIFCDLGCANVTYVIDTSGSMINKLSLVKEHLVETLVKRAHSVPEGRFNVVEFSTEVMQWSDKLVRCTPETVALAAEWVRNLQPKTGTNTRDALLAAFSDPSCGTICLVTDGLPDQATDDILDHVAYASKNRPVHAVYIVMSEDDKPASGFLQELARETYGSFRVVTVTRHGCVERITPVHVADHAAQRMLRSVEGNYFPDNKFCTVTQTLRGDPVLDPDYPLRYRHLPVSPRVVVKGAPPGPGPYAGPYGPNWWRWWGWWNPASTNCALCDWPAVPTTPPMWSRYRPAKAWMSLQDELVRSRDQGQWSPAAGALMIGQPVLARRKEDGLFYKGTVKTQIMDYKFLIEFGPCKHGKFSKTEYQETPIYNIISLNDALRHTVVAGDRVLAPWQPAAEKYGPGVVIEGHEGRGAQDGGPDNVQLTVTFFNGRTEKVAARTAVWVPPPLYDRATLELQMPAEVRNKLEEQEQYPEENMAGYPTSGPVRDPKEYAGVSPVVYDSQMMQDQRGFAHPYYVPVLPACLRSKPVPSATTSEEVSRTIPGTSLTTEELHEKVRSQLEGCEVSGAARQASSAAATAALRLGRSVEFSEKVEERRFEVPVTPTAEEAELAPEKTEEMTREVTGDSGFDDDLLSDSDEEWSQISPELGRTSVSSLLQRRRRNPNSLHNRPPWQKYWTAEPIPEVMDPPSWEPYEGGRESVPLENRHYQMGDFGLEWTSGLSGVVDPYATYKYGGVAGALRGEAGPLGQTPGPNTRTTENSDPTAQDLRDEARRDYRQRQCAERQGAWTTAVAEREKMADVMQDQHREHVAERLRAERGKRADEWRQVQEAREAKKNVSSQIRASIEVKQGWENSREETRIARMQAGKQMRQEVQALREREMEEAVVKREARQRAGQERRHQQVHDRLVTEERDRMHVQQRAHAGHMARRDHFRHLEQDQQKRKEYQRLVKDYRDGVFQAVVKP